MIVIIIIIITLTETKNPLLRQYKKGVHQLTNKNGRSAYLNGNETELDKHIALMECERKKSAYSKQKRREDWKKRKNF
jgi:predicted RNA-binding protein YlxR (DUF448 family)